MKKFILAAIVSALFFSATFAQSDNRFGDGVIKSNTELVRVPLLVDGEESLRFRAVVDSNSVAVEKVSRPGRSGLKIVVINLPSAKNSVQSAAADFNRVFQNSDVQQPAWIDVAEPSLVTGILSSKWECTTQPDFDAALVQAEKDFAASGAERQSLLVITDNPVSLDSTVWDRINPRLPPSGRAVAVISKQMPVKGQSRGEFIVYRSNLRALDIKVPGSLSAKEYFGIQIKTWLETMKHLYLVSFYSPRADEPFGVQVEALSNDVVVAVQSRVISRADNRSAYPEVEEAVRDFDYSKLKLEAVVFDRETVKYWKDNFLPEVKPYLVENGTDCERLDRIAQPLLRLSRVKMQLVVFERKVPTVFTWKETFITFSTAALGILSDDEATALVAHEIGHLYFNERLQKARNTGDARLSRVIELKCDLVALNLLKLSGKSGDNLLSAVRKLIDERTKLGLQSFQPESPSLENRSELVKRFGSSAAR